MKTGIVLKCKADYNIEIVHQPDGMETEIPLDVSQTERVFWQLFEHYTFEQLEELLLNEGFIIKKAGYE